MKTDTTQPFFLIRCPNGQYARGKSALAVAWSWAWYWFDWYVYPRMEQ